MSYPEYPQPGIPVRLTVAPQAVTLALGATAQLNPTLYDAYGNTVSASQPFIYASSNPALVRVSDTGLLTAAPVIPAELQLGGTVTITVRYPWAGVGLGAMIEASMTVTVTATPIVWIGTYSGDMTAAGGMKVYPVGL